MKKTLLSLLFLLSAAGSALAAALPPLPDSVARQLAPRGFYQRHFSLPARPRGIAARRHRRANRARAAFATSTRRGDGRVLNKLWQNPPQTNLGMLFPEGKGPVSGQTWAYIIPNTARWAAAEGR
ncbi:MAG: hypothetical protein WKG07_27095 [Hymenobacter sp.]